LVSRIKMPMDMLWGQELFILPYKDCD